MHSAPALGLAGALYGHFTSYIAPDLFAPLLTLYITLALLAGGLGNNKGAVFGAVVVVFFLEATRFVIPLHSSRIERAGRVAARNADCLALLLILRWRAKGLIPERIANVPLPPPATATSSQAI